MKLLQSKDISFCDVIRLSFSQERLSNKFPLVKLESVISPRKEKIKKAEYKGKEPIVSKISFNDGKLHLRDDRTTGMDLYKLYKDDLLVSNINFHQGAVAINNLETLVCSTHYQPYIVDYSKIDPMYLILVLRNKVFLDYILNQKTNGIKTEAHYNFIKELEIPLPDLEKQKELVSNYEYLQNLATQKEEDAKKIENSIDDYLWSELGIEHIDISNDKKTLFRLVNYMDLNKWIIPDNMEQFTSSKYNFVTFGNIVKEGPSYGANVKGCSIDNGCRYIRITDINDDGSLNNDIAYPERIDNRYLLKENDFLIARSGATVGKTFLYKDKFGKCIYAGYLVRYRLKACIVPEFLFYYTHSSFYKLWVVKNQRVAAQPNINGQEYLNFPLIVPSLKTQEAIIKEIDNKKEKIQKLRNESEQFKQQAISNFEQEVFN